MAVSSFSFDQRKLTLKTEFSGSKKLINHTERQEDGYERGTLSPSATKRDCGTRSEQPCVWVYGGSPGTEEIHSFELFGNFKKAAITAKSKNASQASKFTFQIKSRYSLPTEPYLTLRTSDKERSIHPFPSADQNTLDTKAAEQTKHSYSALASIP